MPESPQDNNTLHPSCRYLSSTYLKKLSWGTWSIEGFCLQALMKLWSLCRSSGLNCSTMIAIKSQPIICWENKTKNSYMCIKFLIFFPWWIFPLPNAQCYLCLWYQEPSQNIVNYCGTHTSHYLLCQQYRVKEAIIHLLMRGMVCKKFYFNLTNMDIVVSTVFLARQS